MKKIFGVILSVMFTFTLCSCGTSQSDSSSVSNQSNIKPPINLSQIQAGDYSSLMGTWKIVACAINAQDGNGNQWRYENGSKNSNKSDITVTNNALAFFNGSCAFEGNTFTENIGEDNLRAHQLEFSIDNGSLIAEITDSDQVAINWWFSFYPKGITNDYGTNNGVKIDNTKNVIIVYCTNNTRATAFEQE